MQTPFASRPARQKPLNANLYGGRLSLVRVAISIALVLVTLAIALVQNGSDLIARKSLAHRPCVSSMLLP